MGKRPHCFRPWYWYPQLDLLGFSMGGIAVQYAALTVPGTIQKLMVAGSRAAARIVHGPIKDGIVKFVKDDPRNQLKSLGLLCH